MKLTIQPYGVPMKLVTKRAQWPVKGELDGCLGMCGIHGGILYVGVFDGSYATLVHELFHAVMNVFEYVGIDPIAANSEPGAYLMDYLFTMCVTELQRQETVANKRHSTGPKN